MILAPFPSVRRATLADVASVARLSVCANREAWDGVPSLHQGIEPTAPDIALRLLEDLDDGHVLYVAGYQRCDVGFAHVTGPTTEGGGQVVELNCIYVAPEHRCHGLGRQLLRFALRDLRSRPNPPALRAWAATASLSAHFLSLAGGQPVRERWKVRQETFAVRGIVFDWPSPDRRRAGERVAAKAG